MIIYFCVHNLGRNLESSEEKLVVKGLERPLLQNLFIFSFFFFFKSRVPSIAYTVYYIPRKKAKRLFDHRVPR